MKSTPHTIHFMAGRSGRSGSGRMPVAGALLRALVVATAAGCHSPQGKEAAPVALAPEPVVVEPVPQEPVLVGRILVIGPDGSFVVFQVEPGQSVTAGEELQARFAGAEVGLVKVNPPNPEYPKFRVADVTRGRMEKGYELVRPAPATTAGNSE